MLIRMYKEMAQRFLLMALYCYDNGIDGDYLHRAGSAHINLGAKGFPGKVAEGVQFLHHGRDRSSIETTIEDLLLVMKADGNRDKELLNEMVRVLGLPNARNSLSGPTLEALKRIILLPDEIIDFKRRLAAKEMSCLNCGREFHTMEVATFYSDGANAGYYCTKCVAPEMAPCKVCGESVPTTRGFAATLSSHRCAAHKDAKVPKEDDKGERNLFKSWVVPRVDGGPRPIAGRAAYDLGGGGQRYVGVAVPDDNPLAQLRQAAAREAAPFVVMNPPEVNQAAPQPQGIHGYYANGVFPDDPVLAAPAFDADDLLEEDD